MSKFSIDSISLIASSVLNIHNENCPICKNSLLDSCFDCELDTSNISDKKNCGTSVGTCNHGYHLHCINTWLKNRKSCPLDNQRWEFLKHPNLLNMTRDIDNKSFNTIITNPPNNLNQELFDDEEERD